MFVLEINPNSRGVNLEILEGNETRRVFVEELAKNQEAIKILENCLKNAEELRTKNQPIPNPKSN